MGGDFLNGQVYLSQAELFLAYRQAKRQYIYRNMKILGEVYVKE